MEVGLGREVNAGLMDEDLGGLLRRLAHHLFLDVPRELEAVAVEDLLGDRGVEALRVQQEAVHVEEDVRRPRRVHRRHLFESARFHPSEGVSIGWKRVEMVDARQNSGWNGAEPRQNWAEMWWQWRSNGAQLWQK